jgi:hypothetical protein
MLITSATLIVAFSSPSPARPALALDHHTSILRSSLGLKLADEDADGDGQAIFKPYQPGEEAIEVPASSRRIFALVLGVPVLAILIGIATYNPTDQELRNDQLRKATRLRGGALAPRRQDPLMLLARVAGRVLAALSPAMMIAALRLKKWLRDRQDQRESDDSD